MLVTSGTPAVLAAKNVTNSISIVMAAVGDAVETGIVRSFARLGGNITGFSTLYPDLEGKRLQILRELVPKLKRLAVIANPANPFTPVILKVTRAAAQAQHLALQVYEVRALEEFAPVFSSIEKAKPEAMAVLADRPFLISNRSQIVHFAARARLPAIYPFPEFVEEGGLVFYGPNFADMFRRTGTYIDKIIAGAKASDLPLEQPTKFDLEINAKTAKALGLTIPQSLLISATKVIG